MSRIDGRGVRCGLRTSRADFLPLTSRNFPLTLPTLITLPLALLFYPSRFSHCAFARLREFLVIYLNSQLVRGNMSYAYENDAHKSHGYRCDFSYR